MSKTGYYGREAGKVSARQLKLLFVGELYDIMCLGVVLGKEAGIW